MERGGKIAGVLLGLVLVASCRPGKAPSVPPRTKIALPKTVTGANLRAVGDVRRGYGTPKARETLSRLKSLNVNTVAILMEGYLENLESVSIEIPNRDHLARIEAALVDANRMGFSITYTSSTSAEFILFIYSDDGANNPYSLELTLE